MRRRACTPEQVHSPMLESTVLVRAVHALNVGAGSCHRCARSAAAIGGGEKRLHCVPLVIHSLTGFRLRLSPPPPDHPRPRTARKLVASLVSSPRPPPLAQGGRPTRRSHEGAALRPAATPGGRNGFGGHLAARRPAALAGAVCLNDDTIGVQAGRWCGALRHPPAAAAHPPPLHRSPRPRADAPVRPPLARRRHLGGSQRRCPGCGQPV